MARHPTTARALLVVAIIFWFGFSAVCTACSKKALTALAPRAGGCALSLTTLQFLISAIASVSTCALLKRSVPAAPRELMLVTLSYTMGFLLLNCSLGRLQASFSETVRGLEPLTSFILVRLLGARGGQLNCGSGAALLTVLGGAALSVWAQPAFDLRGFSYGLLANCAFSSRGLLVTLLQDATRRAGKAKGASGASGASEERSVDPVGLFAAQHVLGLILLAPAAFAAEGTTCAVALSNSPDAHLVALLSAIGFLSYNFLSLCVLLLIDAVSHAVCNTCRRAVTIVAAAIVFRNPVSPAGASGVALIIGGSAAYAVASAAQKKAPATSSSPDVQQDTDALLEEGNKSESEGGR